MVDVVLQACHSYNIESFKVGKHVQEKHGLPFLKIVTDYSQSDVGQIRTRVEALLEMCSAMKPVYFDNAATSWPKPPAMMQAMARFNESIGANPGRSGHRLSIEAARVVYEARELAARIIGAPDPLSIAFTKNATEAINCVLSGC